MENLFQLQTFFTSLRESNLTIQIFLNRNLQKFIKIILVLVETFRHTLDVLFKLEQILQNK